MRRRGRVPAPRVPGSWRRREVLAGGARRLFLAPLLALAVGACADAPWIQPPTRDVERAVNEAVSPFALPPGQSPQEPVNVTALGYDQGSPTARVSVVEFSDFGCGYCRRFHEATFPVLKEQFIDTGKVRWKKVPFAIGMFPNGSEAALAGDCAGAQGEFEPMARKLYDTQSEWRSTNQPYELFRSFAEELGLEGGRFASCLLDERRHARLEASNTMAARLGVRGTPTFFVQGLPVQGAIPTEMFQQILTRMVEETGGALE